MKPSKSKGHLADAAIAPDSTLTLGDFAATVMQSQYRQLVKREPKVLADKEPEHLHQMRVATRRLRTALQVFQAAIAVPKAAQANRVGALARTLGGLRDLDVQMADLQQIYRPQLTPKEQKYLDHVIQSLAQQRHRAYAEVAATFQRSRYQKLKVAYETWLNNPQFTAIAALPIRLLLPELLSPLLAELLLHPGWLIPAQDDTPTANHTLHDLRKACKQARYQTEFFVPFYGAAFQTWVADVKVLQEKLGNLQDNAILRELLKTHLPPHTHLPALEHSLQQKRLEALADWDETRQRYLHPDFRQQLHRLLLTPESTLDLPVGSPPVSASNRN